MKITEKSDPLPVPYRPNFILLTNTTYLLTYLLSTLTNYSYTRLSVLSVEKDRIFFLKRQKKKTKNK